MSIELCRRAVVSGKVQGVWFRASTQRRALQLGVTGWARNLPNGDVEVLMCGAEDAIAELEQWLHKGPPLARVRTLEVEEVALSDPQGFTTG
ncbi:acylphosphatase [Aestuariirhabdus sp. Z084]|uniref:acylphosphatase n=1 Tax=Aestuariirhabdus haliotis TaxID=2918751 RepID=UPI00201B3FF2|nr:acylphosphatase [Aestuariirhabdus haliotis]MCL6416307.1 acylphosphatase [Aestuariirhabdus haliotis]MCL6420180.1 acylphosphatase [Aestuariirhabdus haliotis]